MVLLICMIQFVAGCADNSLDVNPEDENFPLQLILDSDEGADLPDAEDYSLEVTFADHTSPLPGQPLILSYEISEAEGDMVDVIAIDKVVYEHEVDDCIYERALDFTSEGNGLRGTISIGVDPDLGTVPESFEIVFKLPGLDNTEGGFVFVISDLVAPANVIQGHPQTFEYEVLDSDVAGKWELEISEEEQFENFKRVFGSLNNELQELDFDNITGKVTAEFEFGEMKFIMELVEEEEVTSCKDGEVETEISNKEIEIEAEYEAEDGEIAFEGSHFILGGDGEVTDELDFQIESVYEIADDELIIKFLKVVDEENFHEGEELLSSETGIFFNFIKG